MCATGAFLLRLRGRSGWERRRGEGAIWPLVPCYKARRREEQQVPIHAIYVDLRIFLLGGVWLEYERFVGFSHDGCLYIGVPGETNPPPRCGVTEL